MLPQMVEIEVVAPRLQLLDLFQHYLGIVSRANFDSNYPNILFHNIYI